MSVSTSVIVPARNGADFIADALASALVQLDRDDESFDRWHAVDRSRHR
jgi:glycosyltransferase involved in cell wall biosynthesis